MESKRIKTALEIALERAERLGSVSSEELRRQEEEQQSLIGKGLADRHLAGLPIRDVEGQLGRYSGAAGQAVRRGLLNAFVDGIGLEASEKSDSALRAFLYFAPSEQGQAVAKWIERMKRDYAVGKESSLADQRGEIEAEAARLLATRGIAGSAVRLNLEAEDGWQRAQAAYDATFEERLAPLRRELRDTI